MAIDWRHVLTEIWGTFVLTFAICLLKGDPFGISVCLFCTIVGTGNISGAHWNPAVTTAFILVDWGNKSYARIPSYACYYPMQFIGGFIGSFMAWGVMGETLELAIFEDLTVGQAFLWEVLGTYILAYVIITCGEHNPAKFSQAIAWASGLFVILKLGWISGGGYNPAIAFSLDWADAANNGQDRLENVWIYFVPSMIGGGLLAPAWYFVMIPGFRAKWEKHDTEPSTGGGKNQVPKETSGDEVELAEIEPLKS